MAVKNPLCLYGGNIRELQAGDTLPGGGGGGGGSSAPTVTVFTSSGTYANSQVGYMRVILIGGGTGGASGRRGAAGTNRFGGGGGSCAGYTVANFNAADLPASIAVWVGAGGTGAAAVTTNDTNGNGGPTGGYSIFGGNSSTSDPNAYAIALNAGYASGGTATSNGGSQSTTNWFDGALSVSTAGGIPPQYTNPALYGTSTRNSQAGTNGGCGGGLDTANVPYNGGNTDRPVGNSFGNPTYIASSIGGTAPGGNGANGSVVYGKRGMHLLSTGGAGGAAGDAAGTVAGGNGGNGGIGSSGGGGGASTNGANSGAGGNGGNGLVVIIHWK